MHIIQISLAAAGAPYKLYLFHIYQLTIYGWSQNSRRREKAHTQQPSSALTSPNAARNNNKAALLYGKHKRNNCYKMSIGCRASWKKSRAVIAICTSMLCSFVRSGQWNFEWKALFLLFTFGIKSNPGSKPSNGRFDTWRMKQVISPTIKFWQGRGLDFLWWCLHGQRFDFISEGALRAQKIAWGPNQSK